jgi:hypothetical protein
MTPGTRLDVNEALLTIFTAGSEFSADINLSIKETESKTPVTLDRIGILNVYPVDSEKPIGIINIRSPKINIIDSWMYAGAIQLQAYDSDINISSRNTKGTITTTGNVTKIKFTDPSDTATLKIGQFVAAEGLSLGTAIQEINGSEITLSIKAVQDSTGPIKVVTPFPARYVDVPNVSDLNGLALSSYSLSLNAAGNLSVSDVPLFALNSNFQAGGAITLSGVNLKTFDFQSDQTLSMSANTGDLSITNTTAYALVQTSLTANTGKVTLTDSEIGSELEVSAANTSKTSFQAVSDKAELLVQAIINDRTSIFADAVTLMSKGDLRIAGSAKNAAGEGKDAPITIGPTDSTTGSADITSRTGAVNISNTLFKHYAVNITAGGDVIDPLGSRGLVPTTAQERNEISLNRVQFATNQATNAQRVAMDATTIVLKDVSFQGGSDVFLNSFHGKVAARPGENQPKAVGYVNFISGVSYGGSEIKFVSIDGNTVEKAKTAMDNAAFQAAAQQARDAGAQIGDISKIKIGVQTGNAKLVK